MKKTKLVAWLINSGIVVLLCWWVWNSSAICAAFRLSRGDATVSSGVKGGYFLTIPNYIDLATYLRQHDSDIRILASHNRPMTITLKHTTTDRDGFESLLRLKGNIILSIESSLLDSDQLRELREQKNLWSVSAD